MASPPKYQQFFAELTRRHVFRVMAVYGIVGFVVLQVVDLAVPALLLPDWTYRLVALLLLAGFPVAIVLTWAFEQTPEGWKRTDPAAADEIAEIVRRPAARRWPAGILALVGLALLVLGAAWVGRRTAPGSAVAENARASDPELRLTLDGSGEDEGRPTIAVLPFADMSPKGDQEYFSDGITEELYNTLAKISGLKVMARTSAFAFKGENHDIRGVGDSLGVRFVVEGSVRKHEDELRITAQLIDAEDGSHVWSEQYDRRFANVFEIQTEIAEAIADELRIPLGIADDQTLVAPTEDLEAFDLYLTGRARMRERGPSAMEAVELFEAAIARDSLWAPAWAGLAESWTLIPYYAPPPRDSALWARSLTSAERAARRALELDPDNASALVALGSVYRDRWEWQQAEAAYLRALRVDLENVEAYQQYSLLLGYVGRMAEAYVAAQRALALDRAPIRLNVAAMAAMYDRRYEEAAELLAEGIRKDARNHLRTLEGLQGRLDILRGDWSAVRERKLANLQRMEADAAREVREEWNKGRIGPELVPRLREIWEPGDPPSEKVVELAFWSLFEGLLWCQLGPCERALPILEQIGSRKAAIPYGSSALFFQPPFDPLRDEPRFQAILARLGLEGRRPIRSDVTTPNGAY